MNWFMEGYIWEKSFKKDGYRVWAYSFGMLIDYGGKGIVGILNDRAYAWRFIP